MKRGALPIALALALSGCSRPIKAARTAPTQPASVEEIDAAARLGNRRCSPNFAYLFPGFGQFCSRKDRDAIVIAGATTVEVGTAIVAGTQVEVADNESVIEHPAVFIPIVALQDLWVYGVADTFIDRNLARRELFTPRDSLPDLIAAPFNFEVMKQPKVFLGISGMLAVGLGVTFAVSEIDTSDAGGDPNLFGKSFSPAFGYPLGGAVYTGLFTHVGVAEEAMFRGVVQSALARSQGEIEGLIYGSLLFGAVHAPNAYGFEGDERRDYLLYALPTITAIGTYLSYLYMDGEYSLAAPVAAHFWYDFLLSATSLILEPGNSLVSAKLGWSF